jgi:hypothetical protein
MLNLVVKEPETLVYNPLTDGAIKPDQMTQLDPNDPITYQSYAHFAQPLPLDQIVLLNELAQKMSMGLESKEGALRAMGEEFPAEKLAEIRRELIEDAESEGAINLIKVQIQKQIMDMTGMMAGPDGSATPVDPMMMGDGSVLGDGIVGNQEANAEDPGLNTNAIEQQGEAQIKQALIDNAYGGNTSPRRNVDKE